MFGPFKPFRFHQRIALIIAFSVWTTTIQSLAWGQAEEAVQTTQRLIRPGNFPARLPLPPDSAARREEEEVERQTLARIFANGMIIDNENFLTQSEPAITIAQSELFTSDVLIESPTLPDIEVLQGMIEDDNPRSVVVDDLPGVASGTNIQIQLPNYASPDGGLDFYLLAPTRFSRPLPNAR